MIESDMEAFTYEEIKEPAHAVLAEDEIEVRKINRLLKKTKVAKAIYPDVVFCKEEEFIDTDVLPNAITQNDYFADFSYHVIKFNFGIIPNNWEEIEYVGMFLKIEHIDEPLLTVHTPSIFPPENIAEIGKVIREYHVMKSLSVKTPDLKVPILGGFQLPASAGADVSSQVMKRIEYGLKIPRIITAFSGNNDAWWKFYQNEALGPQGQYRTDMIVGLPRSKSKRYNVRMKLTTDVKRAFGISSIEKLVPIQFKSSH
jgi:hypothetical protein